MASRIVALGCPEEKVRVHHLGVRLENLPYRLRRWNGSEPLQFLIASTFAEKKGITYALEALGRVSRELDFQLTIIGDSNGYQNNNIEKKRILEAIDRHGFGSRVRMLGYQPHRRMIEEAYRSHVFMAPSVTTSDGGTEGGAPVAVIEMAATGMPVIASRHCDIPNVILEGRTGWLADERDVAGLADCIRGVASAPSDWERVTMAGRRYIEKEFDAVVQGQRTADIYEGVVGV
jgi:colanic acid/amylovoran biosynthesis glycosyltransferase